MLVAGVLGLNLDSSARLSLRLNVSEILVLQVPDGHRVEDLVLLAVCRVVRVGSSLLALVLQHDSV